MTLADLTDPDAVRKAIAEFEAIGRTNFLAKYGFSPATGYFVRMDGESYDSKAVVGAAHFHQHGEPLKASDFSGGESTVANRLERLGFQVQRPVNLPDWSADERMLALDLYLSTRGRIGYGQGTTEVVALSDELRSLPIWPDDVRNLPKFRNPSGVALKLSNFQSIDPAHDGKGMTNLSAGDVATWNEWSHRPDDLSLAVAEIRKRSSVDPLPDTGEAEEYEAPEGRVLYRAHRRYERDRKLVAAKKKHVLRQTGRLACEVCGFDSWETFGIDGVVEVHHIVPLHKIGVSTTTLADLAVVCPTCHRAIHRHQPFVTPSELRAKLKGHAV